MIRMEVDLMAVHGEIEFEDDVHGKDQKRHGRDEDKETQDKEKHEYEYVIRD